MLTTLQILKLFNNLENKVYNYISKSNNIGLSTYKEKQLLRFIRDEVYQIYELVEDECPEYFEEIYRRSKIAKYLQREPLSIQEKKIIKGVTDKFVSNILQSGQTLVNFIEMINNESKKDAIKSTFGYYDQNLKYSEAVKDQISKRGLVCFTDKGGKNWTYGNYTNMLTRVSTRMVQNYGTLYTFEHIDLYQMSSHNSKCPICRPLEGRVYSRSGTHPVYPPLASAFGKIDVNGPNTLDNTYLNIHPNCLHSLSPFIEETHTDNEIEKIRQFSSFESNPPNIDTRTQKEIEEHRLNERNRKKLLEDYRQYNSLRAKNSNLPKTFDTFIKHKNNNTEKYQNWVKN